ncbi:hypothetical protein HanRHA438_Chr17g0801281 [Helianthus annuus]|nr:hypothetical protein HanRHA438_Chr17g0801281 [Helianthus annuus]
MTTRFFVALFGLFLLRVLAGYDSRLPLRMTTSVAAMVALSRALLVMRNCASKPTIGFSVFLFIYFCFMNASPMVEVGCDIVVFVGCL